MPIIGYKRRNRSRELPTNTIVFRGRTKSYASLSAYRPENTYRVIFHIAAVGTETSFRRQFRCIIFARYYINNHRDRYSFETFAFIRSRITRRDRNAVSSLCLYCDYTIIVVIVMLDKHEIGTVEI